MKNELIYPELSYKLIGFAYEIDNSVGFGQNEKVYSDALQILLEKNKINFTRELYCPIKFEDKLLAKRYFDYLIDDKIVVEIKAGDYKYRETCNQLFNYLKTSKLNLGLIIRFTKNGVKIKRIPCFY